MKRNNKGFAISIMLYAMVLLIVTIFYIILAIVKNRYNTSEELVDTAVAFMETNDPYAAASDKTAPLVVFDHNGLTVGENLSSSNFNFYVFDSDENLSPSGISLKVNTQSKTIRCNPTESGQRAYKCWPNGEININSSYADVEVTARDNKGNTTVIKKRFYKPSPPVCANPIVIDEKTCNQYAHTCKELTKTTNGVGANVYTILQGDYAIYQITCTSNSGVDAFFSDGDITSNDGALSEFKVTTERSGNTSVIKIIVRGVKKTESTYVNVKGGNDGIIKICDSYSGSATNCSTPQLPLIRVVPAAATH